VTGGELRRARAFLIGGGALFLVVFALPLLIAPYTWADWFGWDTTPKTDVGDYFGRCLGAVAIAITVMSLRASRAPADHRWFFDLMALAAVLLALVHLRGLVADEQPLVEHLETLGYSTVATLALWCRPPSPKTTANAPN
jgi:hypothetical protein